MCLGKITRHGAALAKSLPKIFIFPVGKVVCIISAYLWDESKKLANALSNFASSENGDDNTDSTDKKQSSTAMDTERAEETRRWWQDWSEKGWGRYLTLIDLAASGTSTAIYV